MISSIICSAMGLRSGSTLSDSTYFDMLRTDSASLRFFRQRIASFLSPRTDSASLRLVAEAIAVRDTRALVRSRSSVACVRAGDYAGNLTNWRENTRLRCPTTGLRCYSPATLPTGNAGRNRHEPASKVSAPADIQGGDAVSDGKPFGRSDALSVRNMPSGESIPSSCKRSKSTSTLPITGSSAPALLFLVFSKR